MLTKTAFVAILAASTAAAPMAFAASSGQSGGHSGSQHPAKVASPTAKPSMSAQNATAGQSSASPSTKTAEVKHADKDFTKLSTDGFDGFRDIRLARLAIFNGHPASAKTLVSKAKDALAKASKDETAFDKAVDQLVPPKNAASMPGSKSASASPNASSSHTVGNASASGKSDDSQPKTWVPIDGQVTLSDDFVVTPENQKAVAKANQALQKGDKASAVDTLKLAGIDMEYVSALLPVDEAKANVAQATKDLSANKYYEANLDLKKIEDSVAFDTMDVSGQPSKDKSASARKPAGATTSKMASAESAKSANAQKNESNGAAK